MPERALHSLRGTLALLAPPPGALGEAAAAAWAGQQQAVQAVLLRCEDQFRWAGRDGLVHAACCTLPSLHPA